MRINILYLMRILNFKKGKLDDFFEQTGLLLQESYLDVNIALWEAVDRGEISLTNTDKGVVLEDKGKLLNRFGVDIDLAEKLVKVVNQYSKDGRLIDKNRLDSYVITGNLMDPKFHVYFCALDWLVEEGKLIRDVITVEADKAFKRPKRVFMVFMMPGEQDKGFQQKFIDAWLSQFTFKKK